MIGLYITLRYKSLISSLVVCKKSIPAKFDSHHHHPHASMKVYGISKGLTVEVTQRVHVKCRAVTLNAK